MILDNDSIQSSLKKKKRLLLLFLVAITLRTKKSLEGFISHSTESFRGQKGERDNCFISEMHFVSGKKAMPRVSQKKKKKVQNMSKKERRQAFIKCHCMLGPFRDAETSIQ